MAFAAPLGLAQRLLSHIVKDLLPVFGHGVQHGIGGAVLALDDVLETPPSAGPGMGEVHLRTIEGGGLVMVPLQLFGVDVQRGGQFGIGAFAEHTGDVMAVCDPVVAIVAPAGELGHHGSAGQFFLLHAVAHIGPIEGQLVINQRIGVRSHRVFIGRHENAGPVAAHVVMVKIGLGCPFLEQDVAHILGFHDVVGKGVPVVVVAGIFMVERGIVAAFIGGAQGGVIPIGDHDLAVGVEAGHHHQHHILKDIQNLRAVAGEQVIGQQGSHLGAADLGGVEAHALHADRFALFHQSLDLFRRQAPGIGDGLVDLTQLLQMGEVFRGSDDDLEEGVALGGGAHFGHLDPVGLAAEQLIVFHDPIPAGDLVIGPQIKAEKLLGRCDGLHRC